MDTITLHLEYGSVTPSFSFWHSVEHLHGAGLWRRRAHEPVEKKGLPTSDLLAAAEQGATRRGCEAAPDVGPAHEEEGLANLRRRRARRCPTLLTAAEQGVARHGREAAPDVARRLALTEQKRELTESQHKRREHEAKRCRCW